MAQQPQQPNSPNTQAFGTQVATPQQVVSGEPPKPTAPQQGAPPAQPQQGRTVLHAPTPVVTPHAPRAGRAAPPRAAAMPGGGGGFTPQPPRADEKVTPAVPLPAAGQRPPATIKATKATILGQGVPQGVPPAPLDDDHDHGMTVDEFFARPGHVHHDDLPTPKHPVTNGRSAADQVFDIDVGDGLASPSLAPPALPVAHAEAPPAQAAAFTPHQPGGEFQPFQPTPNGGHRQPHQHHAQGHNQQPWSMGGGQPPAGGNPTFAPHGHEEAPIKPPLNPTPWWIWAIGVVIILAIIGCCVLLAAVPALRSLKGRWDNWHPIPTAPAPQRPPVVEPVPTNPTTPPVTPGQLLSPMDHCRRVGTMEGGGVDNGAVNACCMVSISDIQATSTDRHGIWVQVAGQPAPEPYRSGGTVTKVCLRSNAERVRWRE